MQGSSLLAYVQAFEVTCLCTSCLQMQTADGMTSLALALRRRHHDVAQLLMQAAVQAQAAEIRSTPLDETEAYDSDTDHQAHSQASFRQDTPADAVIVS